MPWLTTHLVQELNVGTVRVLANNVMIHFSHECTNTTTSAHEMQVATELSDESGISFFVTFVP